MRARRANPPKNIPHAPPSGRRAPQRPPSLPWPGAFDNQVGPTPPGSVARLPRPGPTRLCEAIRSLLSGAHFFRFPRRHLSRSAPRPKAPRLSRTAAWLSKPAYASGQNAARRFISPPTCRRPLRPRQFPCSCTTALKRLPGSRGSSNCKYSARLDKTYCAPTMCRLAKTTARPRGAAQPPSCILSIACRTEIFPPLLALEADFRMVGSPAARHHFPSPTLRILHARPPTSTHHACRTRVPNASR